MDFLAGVVLDEEGGLAVGGEVRGDGRVLEVGGFGEEHVFQLVLAHVVGNQLQPLHCLFGLHCVDRTLVSCRVKHIPALALNTDGLRYTAEASLYGGTTQ